MLDTATSTMIALRLSPAQVSNYWPLLRRIVAKAIVRVDEPTLLNIFTALMDQTLDLWLLSDHTENPKPAGVILGGVTVDLLVGYRNYLIYGAYTLEHVDEGSWKSIFSSIEKWALGCNCDRLVAYTDSPRVQAIAQLVGCTSEMYVLEKELRHGND